MASQIDVLSVNDIDKTIRIYDKFYATELIVPPDQYDVVYGFFYNISQSKTIAGNFTVFLFRIAQVTGISAMDLLSNLEGKQKLEVNAVIAYYLNSFKSKTALYGISAPPRPNQNIQRNIVQ